MDEEDGDYDENDKKASNKPGNNDLIKNTYELALKKCLKKIENHGEEYLSPEALLEYSPKFSAICEKVKENPGTSLIYSAFRNVEGLKLLSMALDYDGYAELRVKKDRSKNWKLECSDFSLPKYVVFTAKKDETKILMNIFNGDFDLLPEEIQEQLEELDVSTNIRGEFIKMIMITKSGSQGISLKNVRQVHIMEPYWNDSLIKQVTGRAIRAKSHLALPKAERVVDTFIYIMTLKTEHAANALIKGNDLGLTSDEYIYDIAQRKQKINDKFCELMRNASVDCSLHKGVHKHVKCFVPKNKGSNDDKINVIVPLKKDIEKENNTREFKTFTIKSMNKTFMYLLKPNDKDLKAYKSIIKKYDLNKDFEFEWTGIYGDDKKTLIGLVSFDATSGKPKNLHILP
jgi:hypothetical protein